MVLLRILKSQFSSALIHAINHMIKSIRSLVDVNGSPIPISDSIKLPGVNIDSSLAFNKHVSLICQSSQYHIQGSPPHLPILDTNTTKLVVHALVSSRLDHAESIMYGLSKSLPLSSSHSGITVQLSTITVCST